jgi:hypothetical protein
VPLARLALKAPARQELPTARAPLRALLVPPAPRPAPAANGAWYDAFENPEVKTWTAAKGFKDPAAVAESAYNLEKLIGFDKAGRTLVVPKDDATPDEMRAFHAKLGVPETPDGYKLPLPEGRPEAGRHAAGVDAQGRRDATRRRDADEGVRRVLCRAAARREGELIAASDKAFADQTTAWGARRRREPRARQALRRAGPAGRDHARQRREGLAAAVPRVGLQRDRRDARLPRDVRQGRRRPRRAQDRRRRRQPGDGAIAAGGASEDQALRTTPNGRRPTSAATARSSKR